MQVFSCKEKTISFPSSVVTIGNFDGIHLGHRALIRLAVHEAKTRGCVSALVTFEPHPQEIIHSKQSVLRICTSVHQLRLLEELGLDELHVIPFTNELSKMPPEEFALKFLIKRFDLAKLVIGYDFRFGKSRAGDFILLENLSRKYNFSLEEVPPIQEKGQTVSSTLIRELLQEYRFEEIPSYLGRDFSVFGKTVHGEQRGQKIGFPTANIQPGIDLALPKGVYVSKIKLAEKIHFGVTNVGKRPTFGKNDLTVETWLFDFKEDIYGKDLEIFPIFQLRPEKKFTSTDHLKNQIKQDIEAARNYIAEHELELAPSLTS